MPLTPDFLFLANASLLILAITVALIMSGASVRYKRNIGDSPARMSQERTILFCILFLIAIGLIASALNLIFS